MTRRILFDTAPHRGLDVEWLLADGLGGFAMGTAAGVNTRRYHGLLVAAADPPVGRVVALAAAAERLLEPGGATDLWRQQFGDPAALHPGGPPPVVAFEQDAEAGAVTWHLDIDGRALRRRLRAVRGGGAVIEWEQDGPGPVELLVHPLVPLRRFHWLPRRPAAPRARDESGTLVVERGPVALHLRIGTGAWTIAPDLWCDFAFEAERLRGLEWHEDIWTPAAWSCTLPPGATVRLEASVRVHGRPLPAVASAPAPTTGVPILRALDRAAEAYVVRRGDDVSIIAGYPWFADWGRDAMIALPGLLLVRGRVEAARSVLHLFARHRRNGLIPNRFDDEAEPPHYNHVDGSLWFIRAVRALHDAARDAVGPALLDACRDIVQAYRAGTDFDIRMDDDGLITAGHPDLPLTWMDARRDGVVFTARHGKAVEVNALWHRALRDVAALLGAGAEADDLRVLADRARDAFRARFAWPERACLHDVLEWRDGDWRPDGRLRPNQVVAVSLGADLLDAGTARAVVATVRARLLTPYGLRTLDPAHPEYRGRFEGDLFERDGAYHQGTVWPWLLGPFAEAALRTGAPPAEVRSLLQPLLETLDGACLGQLAEVYDGDPPHRPSGCPAQAWSIAEMRRALALVEQAERGSVERSTALDASRA